MKYPEKLHEPVIKSMLECEWDNFVASKKIVSMIYFKFH